MKEQSIYELWVEFQKALETMKFFNWMETEGAYKNDKNHSILREMRTELLERCKEIKAGFPNYESRLFVGLETLIPSVVISGDYMKHNLQLSAAKDFGAAVLFMAWELEQREKEETK